MAMMKVGQVWGRLCILSCLLLTGLLFAGCQTNKADSGFSEVPGVEATAPGAAPAINQVTAGTPGANSGGTNIDLSGEIIKPGDVLLITFADLPKDAQLPAFDQRVKDDGTVTLIYNRSFQAAGKRTGDLEREIRAFYVPGYFINMTPTVRISGESRFYYVDGEVRAPGKFPYVSGITVTKAIASAGGYTDFANKRKVKLIRAGGRQQTINSNKVLDNPEQDPLVFPDDKIHVPRRIL
jgi:protein involved in polysaccharide export with SLBB domain